MVVALLGGPMPRPVVKKPNGLTELAAADDALTEHHALHLQAVGLLRTHAPDPDAPHPRATDRR